MFSKNHPIILFIDRNGFSLFQDTLPNITKFNFTPDIVANLDVISKEQFTNLIATFIQINKIVPSSITIVLSDTVIYEKDLTNPKPSTVQHLAKEATAANQPLGLEVPESIDKEHKEEIQNFLENIPFEEILAKVIKTDNPRIVAVNEDLVMTIADAFVHKGFIIEAIIPRFLYGSSVNFTLGLTQNNVQAILERSEIVKVGNLLTDHEKVSSQQSLEEETKGPPAGVEKKPQNLRQYILIGILVTLLIIFVVVYLNLGASQTSPRSSKIKSSSANTVSTPATVPTLVQASITTVPVDLKNIKIKIVESSQSGRGANNIKSKLLGIGFQDISSEVSTHSTPEKSSVLFSQNIPADVRNNVITQIKKILPDVSILENQDSNLTITILIGKS